MSTTPLILYYSRLARAAADVTNKEKPYHLRAFGIDADMARVRRVDGRAANGMSRLTKQFIAAPIADAVACQLLDDRDPEQWFAYPTLYEVIPHGEPTRFFMDLDLQLPESVGPAVHAWLLSIVGRGVHSWLHALWPTTTTTPPPTEARTLRMAESCDGAKFSAHVITGTWITDCQVQGRAFYASFAAFFVNYVSTNEGLGGEFSVAALETAGRELGSRGCTGSDARELALALTSFVTAVKANRFIDASVYSSNQQFRVLGSGKLALGQGAVRPLRPVTPKISGPRRRYELADAATWSVVDADVVASYLAVPGDLWPDERRRRYNRPAYPSPARRLEHMLFSDVVTGGVQQAQRIPSASYTTPARTAGVRWEAPPAMVTRAQTIPTDAMIDELFNTPPHDHHDHPHPHAGPAPPSEVATAELEVAQQLMHSNGTVFNHVDGSEFIIDAQNRQRVASTLRRGERCFCPHCETRTSLRRHATTSARDTEVRTRGIGEPSAVVCHAAGYATRAIKCWNAVCLRTTPIISVNTTEMHDYDVELDRKDLAGGYLQLKTAFEPGLDLPAPPDADADADNDDDDEGPRFITIDAPMGCGKTRTIAAYIEKYYKDLAVCLPTFRIGLAYTLARLMHVDCYRDKDYDRRRCAVCVNSLRRQHREYVYDLVVVDEAEFVMSHLVGDTMTTQEADIAIEHLAHILRSAKRVIIMQHALSAVVVDWWRVLANRTRQESMYTIVRGTLPFQPALVLTAAMHALKSERVLTHLCRYITAAYVEHYRTLGPDGNPTRKIYVSAATREVALVVYAMLVTAAGRLGPPHARARSRSRVAVIYADYEVEFARQFQHDPAGMSRHIDVLISTPVLQAGISVGPHFKTLVGIMPHGVLSHAQEIQQTMRLRMAHARDLTPWSMLYLEHGVRGALLVQDVRGNMHNRPTTLGMRELAMRITDSTKHDSWCRHVELWQRAYAQSGVHWTTVRRWAHPNGDPNGDPEGGDPNGDPEGDNAQAESLGVALGEAQTGGLGQAPTPTTDALNGAPTTDAAIDAPTTEINQSEFLHRIAADLTAAELDVIDAAIARVPEAREWAHKRLHLNYPHDWDWDYTTTGQLPDLPTANGFFDAADHDWLHTDAARAFVEVEPGPEATYRTIYNAAGEPIGAGPDVVLPQDASDVLFGFGTGDFTQPHRVDAHRRQAHLWAAVLARISGQPEPGEPRKRTPQLTDYVMATVPFLVDLLTHVVPAFTSGGGGGAGGAAMGVKFKPVSCTVHGTAREWIGASILPSPARTLAFSKLMRGTDPRSYARKRTGEASVLKLLTHLVAPTGLVLRIKNGRLRVDTHSFYMACTAAVPWLGLTQQFFATAFRRDESNSEDMLHTLRLYVASCCLASFVGPWHGVSDRGTLNRMLLDRAEQDQLSRAHCSALHRYCAGAPMPTTTELTAFANEKRGPDLKTIDIPAFVASIPHRHATDARAAFLYMARTHGLDRLRVWCRVTAEGTAYKGAGCMYTRTAPTAPLPSLHEVLGVMSSTSSTATNTTTTANDDTTVVVSVPELHPAPAPAQAEPSVESVTASLEEMSTTMHDAFGSGSGSDTDPDEPSPSGRCT